MQLRLTRCSVGASRTALTLMAFAGWLSGGFGQAGAQEPKEPPCPANRLARETSPYLLLHAHNPVDWYPWGPEALEKAKADDKPIFLSIGYSSCHWCHVMERLVFSNPEIARYMNEHFVNIKVDREERPDLDDIYMTALTIYYRALGSSQGGGWPLSLFLTPAGKPIGGGTYFPPEDDEDRDGFPSLMKKVVSAWSDNREAMNRNADFLASAVQATAQPRAILNGAKIGRELVAASATSVQATFDPEYGGFDFDPDNPHVPKFPVPAKLSLLQYQVRRHDNEEAVQVVRLTLDHMAAGGLHDHVGGGFHRYSTDRYWRIPHFEKMLYDNAQLADIYLEAFRQTQDDRYREVAEGIFAFVLRDLTDPAGGFYSALDADSEGTEGKFYVWSRKEIEKLLTPDEYRLCAAAYGLERAPNFEEAYVLELVRAPSVLAEELKQPASDIQGQLKEIHGKLLQARQQRPPVLRDDKILTSWNGLMIRALANAGAALNRNDYLQAAEKAALFVLTRLRDDQGRMLRTYRAGSARYKAYLDDYAFLVEGLLALYQATGDDKWLNAARRLTDSQLELFWDEKQSGCFFTASDHEELLARIKTIHDTVLPSGNSVTVRNLLRLASLTADPAYRTRAERTLDALAPALQQTPRGMANLALAMGEFIDNPDFAAGRNEPKTSHAAPVAGVIQLTGAQAPPRKAVPKAPEHVTGKVYLNVDRLPAGGTVRFLVHLVITDPEWHIQANPTGNEFGVPTSLKVKSQQKVKLEGVRYPPPEKAKYGNSQEVHLVYSKQAVIRGTLEIPAEAAGKSDEVQFLVEYQACRGELECLKPQTLKLKVSIPVARGREAVKPQNEKLFPPPAADGERSAGNSR